MVEQSIADLLARTGRLLRPGSRTLLGLTGAPGSGKSTVAAVLRRRLGDRAALVGMDGFHLAQQELERLGRADRKGAPDTFDALGYAALLRRLRANEEPIVYAPEFDRAIENPIAGAVGVPREVSIVLTEGNYLLLGEGGWTEAAAQLDAVWYLDPPEEVRLRRLLRRHERYGRSPEAARAWALGSDQRNADLVRSVMHRADLIVRVTDDLGDGD